MNKMTVERKKDCQGRKFSIITSKEFFCFQEEKNAFEFWTHLNLIQFIIIYCYCEPFFWSDHEKKKDENKA